MLVDVWRIEGKSEGRGTDKEAVAAAQARDGSDGTGEAKTLAEYVVGLRAGPRAQISSAGACRPSSRHKHAVRT